MATSESKVVVAPDSSGKAIRNLSVWTLIDGVPTQVQMQVLAISDQHGNIIDTRTKPVLEEILLAQQRMTEAVEAMLGILGGDSSQSAGFVGRTTLGPAASPLSPVIGVSDPFGRQITVPWGSREMFVAGLPATITDTSSHVLKAGEPGVYLDMVMLLINNTSSATNARVDISDGTNTYPFQSVGGSGPVGFSSGLIIPASKQGVDWTVTASGAVTDLRIVSLFVRNK